MSDKTLKDKVKNLVPAIKKLLEFADEKEQKFEEVELADGTIISVDPELKEGAAVSTIDADGNATAAADGEYMLKDGTKITVTDGVIEKIEAAEIIEEELRKQVATLVNNVQSQMKRIAQLEQNFAAAKKENEALKAKHQAFGKAITDTLELVTLIADEPASAATEKKQKFTVERPTKPTSKIDEMVQRHLQIIKK